MNGCRPDGGVRLIVLVIRDVRWITKEEGECGFQRAKGRVRNCNYRIFLFWFSSVGVCVWGEGRKPTNKKKRPKHTHIYSVNKNKREDTYHSRSADKGEEQEKDDQHLESIRGRLRRRDDSRKYLAQGAKRRGSSK